MRLVTKAILLLCIVAIGVCTIYVIGNDGPQRAPGATPSRDTDGAMGVLGAVRVPPLRTRRSEDGDPSGNAAATAESDAPSRLALPRAAAPKAGRPEAKPAAATDPTKPTGPVLRPNVVEGVPVSDDWTPANRRHRKARVIQSGDTLYDIAIEVYGDPKYVRVIEAANPGLDPRALRPGERLLLPDPQDAASGAAPRQPEVYVVRKNDTLIGIARRFYGRSSMYRKIYEANRDVLTSPTRLYPGQRLRLPPDE